ncbi:MAG: glycosyltransferase [Flavobacteriales bacterium]|nr:glycosyltransferase [Flavobacteriales bacterium]
MERNFPDRDYKTELFFSLKNKFTINSLLVERIKTCNSKTIFHIHGGFIPEFYHLSRILKKEKLAYVFTPHGAYNHKAMEKNKWVKRLYFNCFEKSLVKNAKAIHCIGDSEVSSLLNLVPRSNCILIPNGQNIEDLKFEYTNLKKRKCLVFGFCGRIDIHTKGLDYLLKGFAQFLNNSEEGGELWVIGDGDELKDLKAMAQELGIASKVTFFGKRFGKEKLNIMANMDAFYHPSRNEGLPGAVLEAAGLKIPCVVSNESNMAGYINRYNAGIGLTENSEFQIARSMNKITRDTYNGRIVNQQENAIIMIKEEFNWNTIATRLTEVYRN